MSRKSRRKSLKAYKHREMQKKRAVQLKNREKLLTGEPLKIKVKLKMPTASQYTSVFQKNKLEENLARLNNMDLKNASDDELKKAINDVISFKPDPSSGHSIVNMMTSRRQINKDNSLYRVRACASDCFEIMNKEADAWNPPEKYTKRGRLNERYESLLYLAEDMETAIKEMKIKNQQSFWLIVYDIKKDINVLSIGEPTDQLSEFTYIHNRIAEFLRNEFTREVLPGKEHEYRVSNIIGKFYYPYNIHNLDGWSYPSVANKGLSSLCLDPLVAKEKLTVKYAILYTMKDEEIIPKSISEINHMGLFEHE
jgi:hypothetical protein